MKAAVALAIALALAGCRASEEPEVVDVGRLMYWEVGDREVGSLGSSGLGQLRITATCVYFDADSGDTALTVWPEGSALSEGSISLEAPNLDQAIDVPVDTRLTLQGSIANSEPESESCPADYMFKVNGLVAVVRD